MTTKSKEIYIGIDVSKATLDVAIWESEITWKFSNDLEGWQELAKRLVILKPKLIAVEASGGFEQPLVAELSGEKLPIAVVNPTRVRSFAKASGQLAKTDKLDAFTRRRTPECPGYQAQTDHSDDHSREKSQVNCPKQDEYSYSRAHRLA
jgi:transposase